ncbi:formin-like protein 4 [Bidens hawaiensis]|uniref:formin-like protein 4 n=1 Tax=Bidens hawaiensis TaxID=980011 RepID=UPI00404964D4
MANSAFQAVVITALTMLILSGICFYFFYRYVMAKKRRIDFGLKIGRGDSIMNTRELRQRGGTLKGVLVEENGLEVLYLRKLEDGQIRTCVWNSMEEHEKRVNSSIHEPPSQPPPPPPPAAVTLKMSSSSLPPPPLPPPPPSLQTPSPPTPPPPPPPAPAFSKKIASKVPPQPLVFPRRNPAVPPPPLHSGSVSSSMKPPTAPKLRAGDHENKEHEERSKGYNEIPKKMKPFHWDKVNTDADHSVVWNEIVDGSLRFDDELIETLFGYNATKTKTTEAKYLSPTSNLTPNVQISLLDPRKSQNIAIVLKSLATSSKEILEALSEGRGLNGDILEKLTKISPTVEEASRILQFNGNPTKLPDAESFLYHILKAIPTAFTRINAMLFRSNYDPEILHLKESLQTIESGCKELRAPGIFRKLLEAILKAGNRMNAGTARGNAKGFNLSALRKLSYVKSSDGKTTLLHFVVEQVVRAEGKRRVTNINNQDYDTKIKKEEKDKQYLILGLPALGGISRDFSNVKRSAVLDYDSLINISPNLTARVNEIRELVTQCGAGGRDGFVKEMKEFLEECEDELKVVREEQTRVMQLVKKTTDFYQIGSSKLEIFGVVKDFLDMVDQVCVDLSRNVQKKNVKSAGPTSPSTRGPLMVQNMQLYFKPDNSSDSEGDF